MARLSLPALFKQGYTKAPDYGLAAPAMVYAGSIAGQPSLSAVAFVGTWPGEIPIHGARRVANYIPPIDPRSWVLAAGGTGSKGFVTPGYPGPTGANNAIRLQLDPGGGGTLNDYTFVQILIRAGGLGVGSRGIQSERSITRLSFMARATVATSQGLNIPGYNFASPVTSVWTRFAALSSNPIVTPFYGADIRFTAHGTYNGASDILIAEVQAEHMTFVPAGTYPPGEYLDPTVDYGFGAPGVAYYNTVRDFDLTSSNTVVPAVSPNLIPDIRGVVPRMTRGNTLGNSVNPRSGQSAGFDTPECLIFENVSLSVTHPLGFVATRAVEAHLVVASTTLPPRFSATATGSMGGPSLFAMMIKPASVTAMRIGTYQFGLGWNYGVSIDLNASSVTGPPSSGFQIGWAAGRNTELCWAWARPIGDGWTLFTMGFVPHVSSTAVAVYVTCESADATSGTGATLFYLAHAEISRADSASIPGFAWWDLPIPTASGAALTVAATPTGGGELAMLPGASGATAQTVYVEWTDPIGVGSYRLAGRSGPAGGRWEADIVPFLDSPMIGSMDVSSVTDAFAYVIPPGGSNSVRSSLLPIQRLTWSLEDLRATMPGAARCRLRAAHWNMGSLTVIDEILTGSLAVQAHSWNVARNPFQTVPLGIRELRVWRRALSSEALAALARGDVP